MTQFLDLEKPSESALHFYVSAIDGAKRYLIAGPYADWATAVGKVDPVCKRACEIDRSGRAHFMAWGTAGSMTSQQTPLGAL